MSKIDELLNLLEETGNLLKKTQINIKKCSKQRLTRSYVEGRLNCLNEYWSTLNNTHQELIKCIPREKKALCPYFVNEEFYIYEELYLCMQADLKDMLSPAIQSDQSDPGATMNTTVNVNNPLVRLPRIQLPVFNGNYEEWPTFQDLFISLVHNNVSISNVQKLHYLKTSVSGEAEHLLKHIQITDSNYQQAWDTLKQRYGNKRLIIHSLLKRLFTQKKCIAQSAIQIKILLDTTTECLNSLQNLEISTESWDPIIIFLVVQKLDTESHKNWEEYAYHESTDNLPTWKDLKQFLESKFRTLELITPPSSTRERVIKERSFHVASVSTSERPCPFCKISHKLCHCKEFIKLQPVVYLQRVYKYVKNNNLCFNCLASGHSVIKCRVPVSCRICSKRHHSLLHIQKNEDSIGHQASNTSSNIQSIASTQPSAENEDIEVTTMIASDRLSRQGTALLGTAMVTVKSTQGHTTILRTLIDPGSEVSLISEKAAQLLRLKRQPVKGSVIGAGCKSTSIKQVVQLQILSHWDSNFSLDLQAYVMPKQLTTKIPKNNITLKSWQHLDGLHLADPTYYMPRSSDLLLGIREYGQILQQGLIIGPPGTPHAQKTNLGWILFGDINTSNQDNTFHVMHHSIDVEDLLKTIWEIDTDIKRKLTKEEQLCEDIYKQSYTRQKDGRYVVKLPFKTENPKAAEGDTRQIALNRLLQLERRFQRMPQLKKEYTEVMEDYLNSKHMEEVPPEEIYTKESVYLPHHAVLREDKETTKTRVVFDASCKGSNGISLNNELLMGPVLQEDLRNIIMRWRMHSVCFASDIQKMYRMILVTKEDIDFQRILWRRDSTEEIKDYRLLTVTFGTTSAPYLAVKTLMQLAEDEHKKYPTAATILKEDFYVDDLLSGCDTVEDAIHISNQLKDLLRNGGFELRKWSSNSPEFMQSIDPAERSSKANVGPNMNGIIKTLGISWNLNTDQFQYEVNLPKQSMITKRTILSDIQKLYDPLGWIAPSIIMAKIFIQKLWLEGVNWDDNLSPTLKEEWLNLRTDFENINHIRIDRWLNTFNANKQSIQLHGFSDASVRAYAAVIYCRVVTSDGSITTKLVASRTRVAPLKTITLPRLELCGAVLLSKLLRHVSTAMRIPASQIYAWTDSSIVLSWLFGLPNRWKQFVANRVVEILENVSNSQWHHVSSQDNPADIASRGMFLTELSNCNLWWEGPEWLSTENIQFTRPNVLPTNLEAKENVQVSLSIQENIEESISTRFDDFDSLSQLLETITRCKRILNYKRNLKIGPITTQELENSLDVCIKLVQKEEHTEEIKLLMKDKPIQKNSNLKSLNPYLDDQGILRVGGRLRHANLDENTKHPIILGHKNKLIPLIVADAHKKTLHGGVQLMMNFIRSQYWVLRGKLLVKNYIHKCLICAKQNAISRAQIMGDLPKQRVTPTRAFLHSGVDFAGPFQVLMSKGRGAKTNKAYIALFVCMSTKAIHLELVGDLTSEAFIGAFKRFVARRGRCTHIWSDQGRNFVGANTELAIAWKEANLEFNDQIRETLVSEGTQWHFVPAYSPNFGGLWEAGVKSTKHHLKRVLTTHLTYEEMYTVICQIEACLNSRPLCPMDDSDIDSLKPLTPGHFLIGEAPITIPSPSLKEVKVNTLSRWQYTQRLLQDFWSRWQQEYLTRLQQRPKWLKKEKEFAIGEIVLLKMDNLPPGKWSLGRITDKHPGPDGVTRVYSVKSGDSVTKRTVTKLCALPIETSS